MYQLYSLYPPPSPPATLVGTDLIARGTPGFHQLGIVSLTVHGAFVYAVRQVDQQLLTRTALKARWMPAHVVTDPGREHSNLADTDVTMATVARLQRGKEND